MSRIASSSEMWVTAILTMIPRFRFFSFAAQTAAQSRIMPGQISEDWLKDRYTYCRHAKSRHASKHFLGRSPEKAPCIPTAVRECPSLADRPPHRLGFGYTESAAPH